MSNKARLKQIRESIIERPTRQDILWTDIIDLLSAEGCGVEKRESDSDAQIIFSINSMVRVFHHRKSARYASRLDVDKIRVFLGDIRKVKLK